MVLTPLVRSTLYENDDNRRESIWTFPRRWRVRFFVIFYSLVISTTAWGIHETVVAVGSSGPDYRSFIVIYVQSIAGSVVTSMLIIDLMRSITMLSNAIEDWLIEKRRKREEARLAEEEARLAEFECAIESARVEAVEYGKIVANCEAQGTEPPPPPWDAAHN